VEVTGSSPVGPTKNKNLRQRAEGFYFYTRFFHMWLVDLR